MDLTNEELKRRYFRETVKEDTGLKGRFSNKFGSIFTEDKHDGERRRSYLDDSRYSIDIDEWEHGKNKKTKEKKKTILSNLVNDWSFLMLLGILMALCAFLIDEFVRRIGEIHSFTLKVLDSVNPDEDGIGHFIAEYSIWVLYAVVMTFLSALTVRHIAAEAAGSGVPEMKVVLRGAVLENFLNFRTLIAIFFGLSFAMGSGMPIGRVGPFIHFSSVIAKLIGQLVFSFDPNAEIVNSKQAELLAVACAVGMSCVFSAPIGGVLFAVEVTGAYFSIKNYWRAFFAAIIATIVSRLLRVLLKLDVTVGSLFPTQFPDENAFFPEEMVFFSILGLLCGFLSIAMIVMHRKIVLCRRHNPIIKRFFDLHANENATNYCASPKLRANWLDNDRNSFLVLTSFTFVYFILSSLASTLPIPNGASGSAFTIGAAFGRLFGELINRSFPDGIKNDHANFVYPGIYSLVAASALCGGFTHTISPAIMAFEMTGQLVAVLPVLTGTLISMTVCAFFQPSFYESLIQLKNLPFLAEIPPSTNCHGIIVQQFMVKNEAYLTPKSSYEDAKKILDEHSHLKVIPVIENLKSKLLLGTLNRHNLEIIIGQLIHGDKRRSEAERRMKMLGKIFSFKPRRTVPSQSNIVEKSTTDMLKNEVETSKSLDASIGRFTVTRCRGWQVVREAILDKRMHQLALYDEYLLIQQREQEQQSNKKSKLKNLAQKIVDVSGKSSQSPDLHGEERDLWEAKQLSGVLDLKLLEMDVAPFRLIAETSLLNCYSLFSLLCLNRAYVTNYGRLVGVITLSEIKQALVDIQKGNLFPLPKRPNSNSGSQSSSRMNFSHFRDSFRRLARKSIVQFMASGESSLINKRWSEDISLGLENKND